jgi:hypothetical protein
MLGNFGTLCSVGIDKKLRKLQHVLMTENEALIVDTKRESPGSSDVFLGADAELKLPKDEVIACIKSVLPDIDFDPDMSVNASSFAETRLLPDSKTDLIVLDYNLVRLLKSTSSHSQKLSGLLYLAVLIGHELAHTLEFRSIRKGKLVSGDKPFRTPPGVTGREAGTAWETRAFGGKIFPVCEVENVLRDIRGLCIGSSSWNFDMMKANGAWIRQLFKEQHWVTEQRPLQPPIDTYALCSIFEDELISVPSTPTKPKRHEKDVVLQSCHPKRNVCLCPLAEAKRLDRSFTSPRLVSGHMWTAVF